MTPMADFTIVAFFGSTLQAETLRILGSLVVNG
jgi:hypothetical protein